MSPQRKTVQQLHINRFCILNFTLNFKKQKKKKLSAFLEMKTSKLIKNVSI